MRQQQGARAKPRAIRAPIVLVKTRLDASERQKKQNNKKKQRGARLPAWAQRRDELPVLPPLPRCSTKSARDGWMDSTLRAFRIDNSLADHPTRSRSSRHRIESITNSSFLDGLHLGVREREVEQVQVLLGVRLGHARIAASADGLRTRTRTEITGERTSVVLLAGCVASGPR